ncbi:hypothetical protein [Dactylosporangium sp. CA-233914]|uniref:hypothetical protein n=1 Tax=Dactylosporangium sp. CA-233914 TaxID=3239934 RepID=UPI003D8E2F54
MPPELVRPYVRVIPIAYIPPAAPRRSTVPPRPVPAVYRPRHHADFIAPPPRPPRRRPARRRGPALAWGALLVALATTVVSLRPGEERQSLAPVPAAESARLQTAVVPAPSADAVVQHQRRPATHPDAASRPPHA